MIEYFVRIPFKYVTSISYCRYHMWNYELQLSSNNLNAFTDTKKFYKCLGGYE